MRVIAGKYRSRLLKSLKGDALRPTSDRLRETLFNILGADVAGSRFLDVFAGTGAVGVEALSRGAVEAIFIEKHAPAAKLIRRNLDSLGITQGATILTSDAVAGLENLAAAHTRAGKTLAAGGHLETAAVSGAVVEDLAAGRGRLEVAGHESNFIIHGTVKGRPQRQAIDFVFVDPPYAAHGDYTRTMEFLGFDAATFLAPTALVIFEHHHKFTLPESSGRLTRTRLLKQGDAALSFFRIRG